MLIVSATSRHYSVLSRAVDSEASGSPDVSVHDHFEFFLVENSELDGLCPRPSNIL